MIEAIVIGAVVGAIFYMAVAVVWVVRRPPPLYAPLPNRRELDGVRGDGGSREGDTRSRGIDWWAIIVAAVVSGAVGGAVGAGTGFIVNFVIKA